MFRTVEAMIDADGSVRLLEPVHLIASCKALVTILGAEIRTQVEESALLSESALSDWDLAEEDEAWAYLQPVD